MRVIHFEKKILYPIFPCIVILVISIVMFALYSLVVFSVTQSSISNYLPGNSDMIDYYLEIKTAIHNGIINHNAGYFGYYIDGRFDVAQYLNWGAHGPTILMPYVILGALIGFQGSSLLIAHAILILIGFYFVYFCTKSLRITLLTQISLLAFSPFTMYFSHFMMEVQMYAYGMIAMSLLYRIFREQHSRYLRYGFLLCVVLASGARLTNMLYLIPYFLYFIHAIYNGHQDCHIRKINLFYLLEGFICVLLIFIQYCVLERFSAPYTANFLSNLIEAFSKQGIGAAFAVFGQHFKESFISFFDLNADVYFVVVRYLILIMAILLCIEAFCTFDLTQYRFKLRRNENHKKTINIKALSLSGILIGIILLTISFYDVFDWRDFRVFSPMLFSVILFTFFEKRTMVIPFFGAIFICLFFGLFSQNTFLAMTKDHFGSLPQNTFTKYITFDAETQNRWNNSLLRYKYPLGKLQDLPSGLGVISVYDNFPQQSELTIRGIKYILTGSDVQLNLPDYDMYTGDDWRLYILHTNKG